jgi:hypothetical protein
MNEASHLSSMSLSVASGVDFFVGMTADVFGTDFVAAGEAAFVGTTGLFAAGELLLSAAGDDAGFSVDTDTLGLAAGDSDVSGAGASGAGAGVEASS